MHTDPQTADNPVPRFLDLLPARARSQLTQTAVVTARVHRAIRDQGWTVEQLAAECARDTDDVRNIGGVITHRLEQCAEKPPTPKASSPFVVRPFCSDDCRANAGWLTDEIGMPVARCQCRTGA